MKQRFIDHHQFTFNHVFSETDDSQKVFEKVVFPLIDLVSKGGNASGKCTANLLFKNCICR